MKTLKTVKAAIALVLTLTTALLSYTQVFAQPVIEKYLSEVYVAYGKDEASAKKVLTDKGFIPLEENLNEAGDTYVMLGYKTTSDIREAVTDLAVMNMRGDYSIEDYKSFLKAQKTQIAEFLSEFMSTVREYRQNLKNNKSKAIVAREILNNYIDDDTGMKMGDLLNSETLQDKVGIAKSIGAENPDKLPDLITILMQGNTQVIKSIEVLLTMAADTAENTWLDRLAETDYDTLLDKTAAERPELNTDTKVQQYLDNLYEDDAAAVAPAMEELRAKLTQYDQMVKKASNPQSTWNVMYESAQAKKLLETEKWVSVGVIYEGLKAYEGGNYKKGELLAYFMKNAQADDVEYYYPMIASLSEGQRCGLPFIGLQNLFSYSFNDEQSWKKLREQNKENFGSPEDISVYTNIDRDIYKDDGSIALTDSAAKAKTVDGAGTTGDKDEQFDMLTRITQISWAATGIATAGTLFSKYITNVLTNNAINPGELGDLITDFSGWKEDVEYAIKYSSELQNFKSTYCEIEYADKVTLVTQAHYGYVIANTLVMITVVMAVITAVITVIDALTDKTAEQLPIPKYIVDRRTEVDGTAYTINYKAAECNRGEFFGDGYKKQTGSCADLNADEGKQWLVLYVSKNSKAGNPLKPEFAFTHEAYSKPGFDGNLHIIGEKGAVNIEDIAFKDYSTFSETKQSFFGYEVLCLVYRYHEETKTYDEKSGNMTASAISGSKSALFGIGGLALGAILGIVCTSLLKKKKKTEA